MLLWLLKLIPGPLMFITYRNDSVTMVTPVPIIANVYYPNDSVAMVTPIPIIANVYCTSIWS